MQNSKQDPLDSMFNEQGKAVFGHKTFTGSIIYDVHNTCHGIEIPMCLRSVASVFS